MNRASSVSIGRIIAVAIPRRAGSSGYRGPARRSLPIDAFIEIAQDTRGHAPNISILIWHRIIMSGDALPVAAVAGGGFPDHPQSTATPPTSPPSRLFLYYPHPPSAP